MNRTYFAGNYYVGNNGVGRTNLVTSPTPIGGTWANYCASGRTVSKTWFVIDTTGKVFYLGLEATGLGVSGTNQALTCTIPTSIARPGSYTNVALASTNTAAFMDGSDGSIWTTGVATNGVLGNNTTTGVSSPVSIARSTSYSKLIGGSSGTFWAIDGATGLVFGWGANSSGQIGDNTKTAKSSPVSIARNSSYKDVAGSTHALFLDAINGSIWVTGVASSGQLGNNTTTAVSSPVSIARPGSYCMVATGSSGAPSSFAIDASDGSIWVWGDNTWGQLGNNTTAGISSPVSIARPGSYTSISCFNQSVVAIDASDGSLWTWGANWFGQLGDGTTTMRSSPVSVLGNRSYVSAKAGGDGIYAMTADGTVYVLGYDFANQLGRQVLVYTNTLIPVLSSHIFAKVRNNIFLDTDGNVWCVGSDGIGSLGDNAATDVISPVSIARPGSYTDIAATYFVGRDPWVSCAAIDGADGSIWVWGSNFNGELGNNTVINSSSPVSLARSASYSQLLPVTSGSNFAAIDGANGSIWVWGLNSSGNLGDGSLSIRTSPVSMKRPGSYSGGCICASTGYFIDASTGNIWATGLGTSGQLGDNTVTSKSSPVSIKRAASYKKVAGANTAAYAIDASDGSLWAWGLNTSGQLGDGTTTSQSSPVSVLGNRSYVDVVGTSFTVFMLDASGTVYALGDNTYGEFGNGTTINSSSPVALPFQNVTAVNSTNSLNGIFTINATAPVVDTQPSNTEKTQGQTATFTVVAHGNPAF